MQLTDQLLIMIRRQVDAQGTLKAFADRVGATPQTVGRWLDGQIATVGPKHVSGLAKALGLSEVELYSIAHGAGEEMMRSPAPPGVDEWEELAKWLRTQPPHVQEPFRMLAKGFGWEGE